MPVQAHSVAANVRFRAAARSHVGRVRTLNEDAVLDRTDIGLWAVADGMGGHDAGDVASRLVIEELDPKGARVSPAAIDESLQCANRRLLSYAAQTKTGTCGSTVVVLLLEPKRYACHWAGDSRAYVLRERCLTQLTRDHSAVQELIDAERLHRADASRHPYAHIITRAVGADRALAVETCQGATHPGDTFLLCSDGVTNLIRDEELADLVGMPLLDDAADALLELALQRHAPDNVSLVLVRHA